jgi:hypothetical protein
LSSKDAAWDGFCWRSQDGRPHQVMWAVKDMLRPHLVPARAAAPPPPKPAPATPPTPPSPPALVPPPIAPAVSTAIIAPTPPAARPATPAPASPPPQQQPQARRIAAPQIEDVTQLLVRNPAAPMPQRAVGQINRIVIHHTAAPPTIGVDVIAKFQVNQRGYGAVSYHFFVGATGATLQTNPLTAVTTQTSEEVNPGAIGIGFAGNFTDAPPPPAQIEAGARLIAWLLQQLRLPLAAVVGQKELIATQSPGIQWDSGANWGEQLRQRIQAILAAR